jgi:DNA polymerase-3 subunit beta
MTETNTVVGSGLRLTCSKGELVRKLGIVSRGLSSRTAVQVLSGILMQKSPEGVILAATDMELSLRCTLDANAEGEGAVVIPGRLLVDLARLLPESDVAIEHRAEENVLRLTCSAASYQLHTYNPEDFPRLPDVETTETFPLDAEIFLATVERVSRCASRDESRPVLTGILVRFEEGKLVMAATDSYRLAVKETPFTGQVPELEAIIPARALTELARIGQGAEQISLGLHENQVLFGLDDVWLTTRRIDGQFPNYKQLLPETFEHEVSLPREELLEVVRRVGVMAQRNSPLRLHFGEGELTVSAQTQDIGEARESLPIGFSGEPLEMGFNADFLREGVEAVGDDELRLKLISPLRPGLIQTEADDFSYLIMPIRLAG